MLVVPSDPRTGDKQSARWPASWFGRRCHDRMSQDTTRGSATMGLRKNKSILDQASDTVSEYVEQVEQRSPRLEKAGPASPTPRSKAGPVVADAKAKAAPVHRRRPRQGRPGDRRGCRASLPRRSPRVRPSPPRRPPQAAEAAADKVGRGRRARRRRAASSASCCSSPASPRPRRSWPPSSGRQGERQLAVVVHADARAAPARPAATDGRRGRRLARPRRSPTRPRRRTRSPRPTTRPTSSTWTSKK